MYQLELIEASERFNKLQREWDALLALSSAKTVFQLSNAIADRPLHSGIFHQHMQFDRWMAGAHSTPLLLKMAGQFLNARFEVMR